MGKTKKTQQEAAPVDEDDAIFAQRAIELKGARERQKKNLFVEPYLPNHNIGIMHLAGMDDDRKKELIFHKIKTLDEDTIEKPLRYQK